MKKQPTITHTEIFCLAIAKLEGEIALEDMRAEKSKEYKKLFYETAVKSFEEKIEAIKQLYYIETGHEY